jgi:hypothetical protein
MEKKKKKIAGINVRQNENTDHIRKSQRVQVPNILSLTGQRWRNIEDITT